MLGKEELFLMSKMIKMVGQFEVENEEVGGSIILSSYREMD